MNTNVSEIMCPWCDEAPIVIIEIHEKMNHEFYAACSDFSGCPDTTGVYPTYDEAIKGARIAFKDDEVTGPPKTARLNIPLALGVKPIDCFL